MAIHSTLSTGGTQPIRPPPDSLRDLAAQAGVRFNGDAPWDIQVHDDRLYLRLITQGALGFGEAYMDGMWDSARMDELFCRLLRVDGPIG